MDSVMIGSHIERDNKIFNKVLLKYHKFWFANWCFKLVLIVTFQVISFLINSGQEVQETVLVTEVLNFKLA